MISIDLKRLRRYRALKFRQPVTQGKHSVKRSLYKALHKRLSLVLRSYRPFLKHQRFAVWSLYFPRKSTQYFHWCKTNCTTSFTICIQKDLFFLLEWIQRAISLCAMRLPVYFHKPSGTINTMVVLQIDKLCLSISPERLPFDFHQNGTILSTSAAIFVFLKFFPIK